MRTMEQSAAQNISLLRGFFLCQSLGLSWWRWTERYGCKTAVRDAGLVTICGNIDLLLFVASTFTWQCILCVYRAL